MLPKLSQLTLIVFQNLKSECDKIAEGFYCGKVETNFQRIIILIDS